MVYGYGESTSTQRNLETKYLSISQANASIKQVDLEWSEISLVCRSGDKGPWLEALPLFRTGTTEMTSSASLEEGAAATLYVVSSYSY